MRGGSAGRGLSMFGGRTNCPRKIGGGGKFPAGRLCGECPEVVYLFQQSRQNIQIQHNKFNKARQPEGQMPIMLAKMPGGDCPWTKCPGERKMCVTNVWVCHNSIYVMICDTLVNTHKQATFEQLYY